MRTKPLHTKPSPPETPQSEAAPINIVQAVRLKRGETQAEFAKVLGVGHRSLKRFEAEARLPTNLAVRRTLQSLAAKAGIATEEA